MNVQNFRYIIDAQLCGGLLILCRGASNRGTSNRRDVEKLNKSVEFFVLRCVVLLQTGQSVVIDLVVVRKKPQREPLPPPTRNAIVSREPGHTYLCHTLFYEVCTAK